MSCWAVRAQRESYSDCLLQDAEIATRKSYSFDADERKTMTVREREREKDAGGNQRKRETERERGCKLAGPPQSVFSDLSRLN